MRCHIPLEDLVEVLNIFPKQARSAADGAVSQEVPERPQMLQCNGCHATNIKTY